METQDRFAPYAPLENVLRVLNKARSGGAHGTIDTSFLMQLGINDSMAPRTVRALHFLGLIQPDGKPTPLLDEYVQASDEESQVVLRQAVEQAYASIFRATDPRVDPRAKIFTAFRTMKPQGQWDRMVTLFLGLCREAGIDVKDAPSARPGRIDSPREARLSKSLKQSRLKAKLEPRTDQARSVVEGAGERAWFNEMTQARISNRETLDPSLIAFLGKLRDIESIESLETWYQAFKALFTYVLATNPKPPAAQTLQKENEDQGVA